MSIHVSLDFVEIDGDNYNLSFIILKNSNSSNVWSNFFRRINWNNDLQLPKNFFTLNLGTNGSHTYHPWCPFHLNDDECSSWLQWSIVRPNNGEGDEIKMLQFRGDPEELFADQSTKTGISSHIQFSIWAEQLANNNQPSLGNLSRMETLVRQTINYQLRSIPNQIVNRVRNELQDREQRKRRTRSRSRSPPHKSSLSQTNQQLAIPQPMPQQQYYIPQQMAPIPQQQVQWNSPMANVQPQPVPSYTPQRT